MINRALKTPDPFAVVRHKPTDPRSHGTHVTGIAAGNGRSCDEKLAAGKYIGVAPGATIVFVQMHEGPESTAHTLEAAASYFSTTVAFATAVAYIFEKARQLNMPCVINASLSIQAGSHDGESVLEHLIDSMLRRKGRALVATAGNVGERCGHASGRIRTGEIQRLPWFLEESSEARIVEIWHRSSDRLRVRLINPANRATPWIEADQDFDEADDGSGNTVSIDYERFTALNGDANIMIELIPTVPLAANGDSASVSTGTWIIEIEAMEVFDGRYDAWVDNVRKSYCSFLLEDFDKEMTISAPGTSFNCVTVANYDHRLEPVAVHPTSSSGPTRDGRRKPDIAAPGMHIMSSAALAGVQADGTRFPVRHPLGGTSQAAPHVTGAIALMLQKAPALTSAQIRELLIAGSARAPGFDGFRTDWGHGILNVERTLTLVDELLPSHSKNS